MSEKHFQGGGGEGDGSMSIKPLRFRSPEALRCYLAVDMACHMLEGYSNQFANTGVPKLSEAFSRLATEVGKLRDSIHKQDQQIVEIVPATEMPKV